MINNGESGGICGLKEIQSGGQVLLICQPQGPMPNVWPKKAGKAKVFS